MPVTIKLPPAAAIEQFFANVPAVQRGYLGDDYHHLRPHKVYDLSLAVIAQRKGLAGARLAGWRSLFLEAGTHRAAVVSASEDDAHSFLAVEEAPTSRASRRSTRAWTSTSLWRITTTSFATCASPRAT